MSGSIFARFLTSAVALVLATAAPAVRSAPPSSDAPVPFGGLHWREIGPYRGGRTLAVTGVPGDPLRFYFGAVGGGVWRSENAGHTWSPIMDGQPVSSIGAIAVAPGDPRTIYVGTGEADMRSDIIGGNGMYVSHDAGATWRPSGLAATQQIGRIVVDPRDPRTLYVAALGHAYAANPERGVFKSSDGGATWRRVLFRDANTGAIDLALDPRDPQTIYASLWQTRRPPWSVYPPSSGPGSGLYKSTDGGATWRHLAGMPQIGLGKIGLAVAPSEPNRVYAIVDAKDAGGLYRSDDAGAHWSKVDGEKRIWGRGWYFCHVAVDPHDADRVYVSDTSLYRSTDGGAHFTAIKGAPGGDDYHMLWIDPAQSERMILASDQGTIVTTDGARTWSSWYNQPTAQIYRVATDDAFPYHVFGAQQDSGSLEIASRTSGLGISMRDWHPLDAGGESDYIAPDPRDARLVYGGRVTREDLETRENDDVSPTLGRPGDFRTTWTLPLVFSQADPTHLYASRQQIFETNDGAASWHAISQDLTLPAPAIPATLDPPTAADHLPGKPRGVVYTLAPSPVRFGTMWAGTDDGTVHLTQNDGASWLNVTPPGVGPWSKITLIEASHADPAEAYVAVDRHRLDDRTPYVYRTRDFGATWKLVSAGLAQGSFLNGLREDPQRRGLLYAATETGVFVSFDDGDAWRSLQLDMPNVSVRDLAIRGDDLVAATHGRGFWILDHLAPLRQWGSDVAVAPSHLFAPAPSVRTRPGDDEGTPLPPETPQGENPAYGVPIDYSLAAQPKDPVVFEILDAAGAVVRRYASDDAVAPVDAASLTIPAFWIVRPAPPSAAAGTHRFYWDFRYAAPRGSIAPADDTGDAGRAPDGLRAPPGRYAIRMTVDGATQTQDLDVARDPRIRATDADLRANFELARQVQALRTAVPARATARAAALDALLASLESADAAPTKTQIDAFAAARAETK